jgi:hypothetical protein
MHHIIPSCHPKKEKKLVLRYLFSFMVTVNLINHSEYQSIYWILWRQYEVMPPPISSPNYRFHSNINKCGTGSYSVLKRICGEYDIWCTVTLGRISRMSVLCIKEFQSYSRTIVPTYWTYTVGNVPYKPWNMRPKFIMPTGWYVPCCQNF